MGRSQDASEEGVVVLFKGGRLPTWNRLSAGQRKDFEQRHVDLMLSIAQEHNLMRMEGFRLMTPQQSWVRLWAMEFPDLKGAEAWIEAEMAPPYGAYGYYEYYLSRSWKPESFSGWAASPPPPIRPPSGCDPHVIPPLDVDRNSVVVLQFGRRLAGAEALDAEERGDLAHVELMKAVAREHGLMRLEVFRLISPQSDWHWVWVVEFPTFEGPEAWVEAEGRSPHGDYTSRTVYLARRWAPEYFSSWTAPAQAGRGNR